MKNNKDAKPLIIGHRGANNEAPENTLKSFREAIELGADYIEFDVQGTKDNELVIIHDENTYKTSNYNGIVKEMTLKELKKLDFGEGEKIPTLEELINLAKGRIGFQCEIKSEGIAIQIAKIFQEKGLIDSTLISSFKHDELKKIQAYDPNIRLASLEPTGTGWITDWIRRKKIIDNAVNNKFEAIHPMHKLVNDNFIKYAHKNNLKVNTWTVDSRITIKKLIKKGIDGIITNNIKLAKSILENL